MELIQQMLGERVRSIFHPLEIGPILIAAADDPDIREAVGFERLSVPVEIQRLIGCSVG